MVIKASPNTLVLGSCVTKQTKEKLFAARWCESDDAEAASRHLEAAGNAWMRRTDPPARWQRKSFKGAVPAAERPKCLKPQHVLG